MKIIRYIMVEGDTAINQYLEAGFQLYGNPMLKTVAGTAYVTQAMVLYQEEQKESKGK